MAASSIAVPKVAEVVEVKNETRDTKTFRILVPDRRSDEFRPGQFIMVYLKGFGEIPISLSDLAEDTDEGTMVTITVRGVGVVSRYMLSSIKEGDKIGIRGPYGRGWPVEEAKGKNVIIAGGGIGFAPLRPVLKFIQRKREEYGRLIVIYGSRGPAEFLYKYELDSYRAFPGTEFVLTVDRPAEGWEGEVGLVPDILKKIRLEGDEMSFICGPEIMMKIASKRLVEMGAEPRRIFVSLERRMRCGFGVCGTCQLGHYYVCKDGPVFSYEEVSRYMEVEGI
ncbi:MAG: FAD/NAD(P)-binding protein [Fervidicoccaceae archaeon]